MTVATTGGLTALVAAIVAYLPKETVRAPSGTWHWAFMQLRDKHSSELPELSGLEFSKRPGVSPVSERLERILQIIDIGGTGSTLNPMLVTRQFDRAQKERLKRRLAARFRGREEVLEDLGKELQDLLDNAPPSASSS